MPELTVGYEWFKKILGTGIKNNLYYVKIPELYSKVKSIEEQRQKYFLGSLFGNTVGAKIVDISNLRIIKDVKTILEGSLLSLCKGVNYPSEGYDILTNSYWTRKTAGKINLNPLQLSFYIDGKYKTYDIFNYLKNSILLDKEHGVFNYPEKYTFNKISVATFNPSVFTNVRGISFVNIPIYIKNFYNCMVSNVGEVSKDSTAKDTLEEFTVTIEYEHSNAGESADFVDTELAKVTYDARNTIGLFT